MTQNDLLYTKEHEWLKLEGEYAYVGITDHAQSELGDIIFIELPDIEDTFNLNDVFGTIEAVKTVADLFMPVDGQIVEVNTSLDNEPENINKDPYNDGWIIKIKLTNKENIDNLLSFDEYKKII